MVLPRHLFVQRDTIKENMALLWFCEVQTGARKPTVHNNAFTDCMEQGGILKIRRELGTIPFLNLITNSNDIRSQAGESMRSGQEPGGSSEDHGILGREYPAYRHQSSGILTTLCWPNQIRLSPECDTCWELASSDLNCLVTDKGHWSLGATVMWA